MKNKHDTDNLKHNFPCDYCDKTFITFVHLWDHKKFTHKTNAFQICHICEKNVSNLKKHFASKHNHKCDKCEETFSTENELDSHFVSSHVDQKFSKDLIKRTQLMISSKKEAIRN